MKLLLVAYILQLVLWRVLNMTQALSDPANLSRVNWRLKLGIFSYSKSLRHSKLLFKIIKQEAELACSKIIHKACSTQDTTLNHAVALLISSTCKPRLLWSFIFSIARFFTLFARIRADKLILTIFQFRFQFFQEEIAPKRLIGLAPNFIWYFQ